MSQKINTKIEPGVSIRGLRPEMAVAMHIVAGVFADWGFGTVITSGTEGTHGRASLHYVGAALDYRIRHVKASAGDQYDEEHSESPTKGTDAYYQLRDNAVKLTLKLITAQIGDALADDFDVVLESNHIHVEYQPKGASNA